MNKVFLIGRLTKDPEIRYNYQNIAITRFTLAVARAKQKDREEETDFISCVCFNNQAKNFVKYQKKGNLVAVFGRLRTGFYDDEKTNKRVYTTDVIADRNKEIQELHYELSRKNLQLDKKIKAFNKVRGSVGGYQKQINKLCKELDFSKNKIIFLEKRVPKKSFEELKAYEFGRREVLRRNKENRNEKV